jgi:hypothetical protein
MLAEFFTKPLQGSLFVMFRNVTLGYKHVGSLYDDTSPTDEERAEEMMWPDDKESSKSSDDRRIMRNDEEMTDEKEKPRTTSSTGKAKITWKNYGSS